MGWPATKTNLEWVKTTMAKSARKPMATATKTTVAKTSVATKEPMAKSMAKTTREPAKTTMAEPDPTPKAPNTDAISTNKSGSRS